MSPEVVDWLRDVLRGHTSEEQIRDVLAGWERYFSRLSVPEDEQCREFDAIMRMRAANGEISVLAYDWDDLMTQRRTTNG